MRVTGLPDRDLHRDSRSHRPQAIKIRTFIVNMNPFCSFTTDQNSLTLSLKPHNCCRNAKKTDPVVLIFFSNVEKGCEIKLYFNHNILIFIKYFFLSLTKILANILISLVVHLTENLVKIVHR